MSNTTSTIVVQQTNTSSTAPTTTTTLSTTESTTTTSKRTTTTSPDETITILVSDTDDSDEDSSSFDVIAVPNSNAIPSAITTKIPLLPVTYSDINRINSTKTSRNSRSPLPIILGSIFGSLAIIVLITSIITYVLIKRGYIKVFNQPQTRTKDTGRTRLIDSSSTIGDASPSQR